MLFQLGQLVATPGALDAIHQTNTLIAGYLRRYTQGDWGEMCEEDVYINDQAVLHGGRIMGAYNLVDGTRIWIITEADRSVTTILLPEEY